ncbi:MAG: peptidase U32 family protein [Saccharofermentanales bacterium]
MNRVELLSPAGDLEKLRSAVLYGADAVYLSGKQFGLRAFSGNFDDAQLAEGIRLAHANRVKAYVTVNIFGHPRDFSDMAKYILYLAECGADALIVSDAGIFSLIREIAPDMEIHISTQSSITNAKACEFWYRAGASRIVLARELTIEEIIQIRKDIPPELELEVFVHGAMCMTYSGRCMLSSYFTGRDGNRGECAQPCRWKYQVTEVKRPDMPLEIVEDDTGTYLFNSKDMCMIGHIPELVEAGINCFKIEGRMKGVFYVSTVTKAYREAIDAYYEDPASWTPDPLLLEDLRKTVHREFDTGFFFTRPGMDAKMSYNDTYIKEAKVVGVITGYDAKAKRATVEQRNKISEGERVEIVSPKGRHFIAAAKDLQDEQGNKIESTPHPLMVYTMSMRVPVVPGSFMRMIGEEGSTD